GGALAEYFRTRSVQRQTLYADRAHSIGGAYPRFLVGNRAVIAVDPDESQTTINAIMRAAILWSALIRRRLTVVVPRFRSHTIGSRLRVIRKLQFMFEWLEWDEGRLSPLVAPAGEIRTE